MKYKRIWKILANSYTRSETKPVDARTKRFVMYAVIIIYFFSFSMYCGIICYFAVWFNSFRFIQKYISSPQIIIINANTFWRVCLLQKLNIIENEIPTFRQQHESQQFALCLRSIRFNTSRAAGGMALKFGSRPSAICF